jgi:hypothetical protein
MLFHTVGINSSAHRAAAQRQSANDLAAGGARGGLIVRPNPG